MTRAVGKAKRNRAAASGAYSPDAQQIASSATTFRWEKERLVAVLSQFGELPVAGQRELIDHLVGTQARFQNLGKNVHTVTETVAREQLRKIEKSARTLLKLLGVDVMKIPPGKFLELCGDRTPAQWVTILDGPLKRAADGELTREDKAWALGPAARLHLSLSGRAQQLRQIAEDRHNESELALIRAELQENTGHCDNAIVHLCWIYLRAKAVAAFDQPSKPSSRGGKRNEPTQKGQVIRDALKIYAQMREQYPNSGSMPALGPQMREFVRLVGLLFDVEIDDREIDEVSRPPRRRVSKKK